MSTSSTHRRWKGHCLMCAENSGKLRGAGMRKYPWKVQRLLGKKRRFANDS